ncbi:MAG TPA: hypothetical protein VIY48_07735 [Candidatus Paceibacterota bacterium]
MISATLDAAFRHIQRSAPVHLADDSMPDFVVPDLVTFFAGVVVSVAGGTVAAKLV